MGMCLAGRVASGPAVSCWGITTCIGSAQRILMREAPRSIATISPNRLARGTEPHSRESYDWTRLSPGKEVVALRDIPKRATQPLPGRAQ